MNERPTRGRPRDQWPPLVPGMRRLHTGIKMTLSETLRTVLAPPHPAGQPFIIAGVLVALLGLAVGAWMFWLGLLFLLFCLYFFRDPERVAPGRPGAVVAPPTAGSSLSWQWCPRPSLGWARRRAGESRHSCR